MKVSDSPLVSVILPTYNRGHSIAQAAKSVLEQSYSNIELIICDDGSTDDTRDVVSKLNDGRIRYLESGANRGAPAARNMGIMKAKGEYVAFQDSDDCWDLQKLAKQVVYLNSLPDDYGVVYSSFLRITEGKKVRLPASSVKVLSGSIHRELVKGNFIGLPTVLMKRRCFDHSGLFDETLKRFQDWELFIRLSSAYKFGFCDEILLTSYHSKDSITGNIQAAVYSLERILQRHRVYFSVMPIQLSKHYFFILRGALRTMQLGCASRSILELIRSVTQVFLRLLPMPSGDK